MADPRACRGAGFLLAAGLLCFVPTRLTAFVAAQLKVPSAPLVRGPLASAVAIQGRRDGPAADSTAALGLCGAAAAVFLAEACVRRARVAMRGQGQGGRFNFGQHFMPRLKSTKKKAVLRPRKPYGSYHARRVPRRYELYDKLEEYDETLPWYTIISEPEEPLEPVEDAPLLERYPWAGPLEKVHPKKVEMEAKPSTALEPLFGSYTRKCLPPKGRRQLYVHRKGWPSYHSPPWLNRPLEGTAIKVPGSLPWKKDRRPKPWQLPKNERAALEAREKVTQEALDEVSQDVDDELDALEAAAED